jgi:Uma2 family endonuclease
MTVMARETHAPQEFLLQDFLALDTPEGYRAELIDGEIVVTPPPDGDHEYDISMIVEQVLAKSVTRMNFAATKGLDLPGGRVGFARHVIPDITLAPAELRLFRGAEPWMPPAGVAMVVEVTSSRPERDRDAKRHAYAAAGIPLYLLVDRERDRVALFSEPAGEDYETAVWVAFGKGLKLPAPFSFELDTEEFGE